jgi:hypothetical protein
MDSRLHSRTRVNQKNNRVLVGDIAATSLTLVIFGVDAMGTTPNPPSSICTCRERLRSGSPNGAACVAFTWAGLSGNHATPSRPTRPPHRMPRYWLGEARRLADGTAGLRRSARPRYGRRAVPQRLHELRDRKSAAEGRLDPDADRAIGRADAKSVRTGVP